MESENRGRFQKMFSNFDRIRRRAHLGLIELIELIILCSSSFQDDDLPQPRGFRLKSLKVLR